MLLRRNLRNSLAFGLLLFAVAPFAHASSGNIDSIHKYAWSNVGGFINLAPSSAGITVSDTALTGYAWSANDGWINFSPTTGGVTNNGQGALGGWAWDSAAGWFSFSGVSIDRSGKFHGQATGANGYAINFDCSSCDVETTWRITNTTATSPGAISPVTSSAPTNRPPASVGISAPQSAPPSIPANQQASPPVVAPPATSAEQGLYTVPPKPVPGHGASQQKAATSSPTILTKHPVLIRAVGIAGAAVLVIFILLFIARWFL